jgi:hypothetical protein
MYVCAYCWKFSIDIGKISSWTKLSITNTSLGVEAFNDIHE